MLEQFEHNLNLINLFIIFIIYINIYFMLYLYSLKKDQIISTVYNISFNIQFYFLLKFNWLI